MIILDVSYSSDYNYNILSIKISSKTVIHPGKAILSSNVWIKSVMGTGIAFGPYNVIIMRSITDRVTALSLIQETNGFAQALCGEFIRKDRSTKVRNRRRCSSLFSLSKSHVRKLVNLSVNCGFRTRVLKPRNFLIVKDFSLIFATQAAL